jgi:ubiquitin carboxyl-terminal hydrolase 34
MGTAEFGHYYSFINVDGERWYEFNDSHIRDFDPSKIESECYGGSSSNEAFDDAWVSWTRGEQSKNAYILVYDRKIKEDLLLEAQTAEELLEIEHRLGSPLKISEDKRKAKLDFYGFKRYVPANLYKVTKDIIC